MLDGKKLFDQPNKSYKTIQLYENIRKITIGKDDNCNSFLVDYPYLKGNFKMTATDLTKQHAIDADPKGIQ